MLAFVFFFGFCGCCETNNFTVIKNSKFVYTKKQNIFPLPFRQTYNKYIVHGKYFFPPKHVCRYLLCSKLTICFCFRSSHFFCFFCKWQKESKTKRAFLSTEKIGRRMKEDEQEFTAVAAIVCFCCCRGTRNSNELW